MDTNGHTILFEDYVSFEIAKLLAEKGFDELSTVFYNEDGTDLIELYDYEPLRNSEISGYARVTQSLALKWLREVYRIETHIVLSELNTDNSRKYMFDIYSSDINRDFDSVQKEGFNSYEQAVEAACLYVLKNLI